MTFRHGENKEHVMHVGQRLAACLAISVVGMVVPGLLPGLLLGQQVPKQVPEILGSSIKHPRDAKAHLERTLREVEAGTTVLLPFELKTADGRFLSLQEYVSMPHAARPRILESERVPVGMHELDSRLRAAKISEQERKRALAEIVADSKSATKKLKDRLAAINRLIAHESPHEPPLGDGMRLWTDHYTVQKGKTVNVKVYLINAKDVRNVDFALDYDSSLVAMQGEPVRGAVVEEYTQSNLERPGLLKFNFARLAPFTYRGLAEVAGFTFEGLNVGTTPLKLSLSPGNKLPLQPMHGSIQVHEGLRPPGTQWPPTGIHPPSTGGPTCSGTGRQSPADVQCCLKMWVGIIPTNPIMNLNGDRDDNGNPLVDSNDAIMLMDLLAARREL